MIDKSLSYFLQEKLGNKSWFNLYDGEDDEYKDQDGGLYPGRDDFEDDVPFNEEYAQEAEAESKYDKNIHLQL